MWIFTQVADWFDKTRTDNDRWIDQQLQPWVGSTLYEDSPWYRNVGVWTAAGTLYSLNKFTTTVASGFVDVLRVGDGVKEGGWRGWGKDALRVLMIAGPALRGARFGVSLLPAVDIGGPRCAWVGAARLLRFTGARPLAEVSDVAKWMGVEAADTRGIVSTDLAPALNNLGADARVVNLQSEAKAIDILGKGGTTSNWDALNKVVKANPNGAVQFGVTWTLNGKGVGHSMIAFRGAFGGMKIIDRTGKLYSTLAELQAAGYPGIGGATVKANAMVVQNTLVVKAIGTLPTLGEILSQIDGPEVATRFVSAPAGAASIALPPDAQRLYNALPAVVADWKAFMTKLGSSIRDPYGSLQTLEKAGKVKVTRWGNDDLNIKAVVRL